MTVFELESSFVRSNHSSNCAMTTQIIKYTIKYSDTVFLALSVI